MDWGGAAAAAAVGNSAGRKAQVWRGACALAVGAGQPVANVEQLACGGQGIGGQDFAGAVHCQIAQVFDELGLGEHRIARRGPKRGLVNQGAQVVLVGQAQGLVMLVEPVHRQLQRAPGVEAGGACIRIRHPFGLAGRSKKEGPFRLKEGEVAHLQFAPEGAVLEGGEEGVEFRQCLLVDSPCSASN